MKIIVTGADGFVGRHLVNYLKKISDAEVFPLDLAQADITNFSNVKSYLEKIEPDQVYHLAGFASGAGKDKDLIFEVNVLGTVNILRALQMLKKPVRVLLASTAYVYGNTDRCVREDGQIDAKSFYDQSKVKMEKEARRFLNSKLKIMITRATNHAGPGQKLGFAIPDFASQLAKAKDGDEILTGNLEAKRDLFDVRDCVRAYVTVMQKGRSGEVYNIGTGCPQKIQDVLEKLIEISGKNITHKDDPKRMRPSDIAQNCVDASKVRALGWEPKIEFEKTLKDTYEFYKDQKSDIKD